MRLSESEVAENPFTAPVRPCFVKPRLKKAFSKIAAKKKDENKTLEKE